MQYSYYEFVRWSVLNSFIFIHSLNFINTLVDKIETPFTNCYPSLESQF